MPCNTIATCLILAAKELSDSVNSLSFPPPITHVYNPLDYAWDIHERFIRRFGSTKKRVLFLGMNPGPFGMVQSGIPFGEIKAVKEWLQMDGRVRPPKAQHPNRPIHGLNCTRSEVSGARLWGLFAKRFGTPDCFFRDHYVLNYCPLAFLEASGRNFTPDKLPATQSNILVEHCDVHLRKVVQALAPEWLVGIGGFAEKCLTRSFANGPYRIERILHPSPASPASNKDWAGQVERTLETLGVW